MILFQHIDLAIENSYIFLNTINNNTRQNYKFSIPTQERLKAILQTPIAEKLSVLRKILCDLNGLSLNTMPTNLQYDLISAIVRVENTLEEYFIKYWANRTDLTIPDLITLYDLEKFGFDEILKETIGELNGWEYNNLLDEQKAFERVKLCKNNWRYNLDSYDCYLIDTTKKFILRGVEYNKLGEKDHFELKLFSKHLRLKLVLKSKMKINPDQNSHWIK